MRLQSKIRGGGRKGERPVTLRDYLNTQSFLRDADHGVDGSRIQQVSERGVASQGRRLTQTDGRSSTRLRRARGSMWVSMPQCQRVKCHHHRPFHLRHVSARRWKPRLLPERATATDFFSNAVGGCGPSDAGVPRMRCLCLRQTSSKTTDQRRAMALFDLCNCGRSSAFHPEVACSHGPLSTNRTAQRELDERVICLVACPSRQVFQNAPRPRIAKDADDAPPRGVNGGQQLACMSGRPGLDAG